MNGLLANKCKVMVVNHHTHPQIVTGAEKALLMLGLACLELQVQVIWISPAPGLSHERAKQMGMDVKVVPFPLLWSMIFNPHELVEEMGKLQGVAEGSGLNQTFINDSPDLVITNSAINVMPALIARKKKIPLWWYIHEVLPKTEATGRLLSLIHSHADQILVPSQTVAESIGQSNEAANRIALLPYGVGIPPYPSVRRNRKEIRSEHGWTDNHLVIGWFGSVYQGKGLLEFIRATSYFKDEEKTIVFLAAGNVGDRDYFSLCQEEAREMKSVEFRYLGVLPEIAEILPSVDMVVIPSLVEEAFPNVALEAMAYGKCIVAYKSGGLKEIVIAGKTGMLVDKGDIASLGAAIHELIKDPADGQISMEHCRRESIGWVSAGAA